MAKNSEGPAARPRPRPPHPSPETVARALSHAFLATDEWSADALMSAGAVTLGARRRWLGPLVRAVLESYHRKPSGSLRELAAYILLAAPFQEAVANAIAQRRPLRIAVYATSEPGVPDGVRAVPAIPGLQHLAKILNLTVGELDWFADTKHWNRLAPQGPLHHYRYVWRQRPGRTPRLLEVPGLRLRIIQRQLLDQLLSPIAVHPAAHGFVPGRSASTGAAQHTGRDVVLAVDLLSFFARVGAGSVYGALRRAGFPEAVAYSLTGLCTHVVPPRVITAMPPGGAAAERFTLAQALRQPHLPQGAPTSPALANITLRRLDSRLQGWAEAAGARYTRYADDLTFSGDTSLARRSDGFLHGVEHLVEDEGHALNHAKTRVRPRSTRQQVTGIVVNQLTNVPRREFDRLKATLHNCALHGPQTQNHAGHPDFAAHLLGRINWVESLNPGRGARLRRDYDRINWQV